jgi:hypothetical protein
MKKLELQQIIKEEIIKILNEGGVYDTLGSVYGAFQTPKITSNQKEKLTKGFVITNGKEWYAGAKNYLVFAKVAGESNLYPTYTSAQNVLFNEIPDDVVKSKQLKINRY